MRAYPVIQCSRCLPLVARHQLVISRHEMHVLVAERTLKLEQEIIHDHVCLQSPVECWF